MKRKTVIVITVCIMAFAVTGCGGASQKDSSKDSVRQESLEDEKEEKEETSEHSQIEITSYEDIEEIYQFDLEGAHYELPCTVEEFMQNGCTISDSYLQETVSAQHSIGLIKVHPNGDENKYIYIEILNDTDQDKTVQECQKVIGVSVCYDSEVSFVLNSGVKLSYDETFLEDLKKMYGMDETIYQEETEYVMWSFYHAIPREDDSLVVYSMLQPGTDYMRLDNTSFELQYIPLE